MTLINYKNPLLDEQFLKELAACRDREIFAKIIALDLDENPIEEIEGRVTQGSVPVDGKSAVRRTCSLTLVAQDLNINDYVWGVKTKIKLHIGLLNSIDSDYPPIVWFPMGTFVLTAFNNSTSTSGHTISLQGKDKMCLLNGDVGGNLTALSYDFGTVKVVNKNGSSYEEQVPIKTIIQEAVHEYAQEPYHNIILNDLDDCGLELIEYRGDSPLYFIYDVNTQEVSNMTLNQNQFYYYNNKKITIAEMEAQNEIDIKNGKTPRYVFKTLNDNIDMTVENIPTNFFGEMNSNENPFNLIKVTKGMTCGYRTCELVYAGKLTASAGEPITTILSKIVNMLGNYEYFYNLDGQFVFQRKRTYINTSWNNMVNNGEEQWVENSAYTSSFMFSFEDGILITSYQNNPDLNNLKNDFSIWGAREGVGGAQIPIHLRYAIDEKPVYYTSYDGKVTYTTKTKEEVDLDIEMGSVEVSKGFIKTANPIFNGASQPLPEDWWEAKEWAEYYKACTGDYPKDQIGKYAQRVSINYADYFKYKCDEKGNIIGEMEPSYSWNPDVFFTVNGNYYTSHGGCVHYYEVHLMEWQEQGQLIFIHKPELPEEVLKQEGVEVIPIGSSVKYNLDWRELIYQMAQDHKNYGSNDDFLMTISKYNKGHYPSGYTGYEQYYTDIDGFWRQLYNPDYTVSYDTIYLSKNKYIEEGRLEKFFYDAPIYTQCKDDDPFFPNTLYYTQKADGEYESCPGLLQTEYGKNPNKYWLIIGTEIQPVPLVTEPFTSAANSYWRKDINGYVKASNINKNNYEQNAKSLYLRVSSYSYFPCVVIKPYIQGKMYFIKNDEGEFRPDATVKEDIYLASPGKYYERVYDGGQIKFINCTTSQPYSQEREYYNRKINEKTQKVTYTKVNLNASQYEALGYENNYYYATITYSYIPCIHPKYDYDSNCNYYVEGLMEYDLNQDSPNLYWNFDVQNAPEILNFWFDFLDTYGELSQYSVSNIGDRPKAINDSNVKAIYFRETPGVIFVENLNEIDEKKSGYTYAQLPQHLEYLFSISGQSKSAKDVLDEFLYNYSYCTESITINAIPVYHLEPNTRIFVRDDTCGINGEYIISRINFPLASNGTMSITATKVVDRIY